MRAKFSIENPKDIECTMQITMTLEAWESLRDQLNDRWPAARLSQAITKLMIDAKSTYHANEKDALS